MAPFVPVFLGFTPLGLGHWWASETCRLYKALQAQAPVILCLFCVAHPRSLIQWLYMKSTQCSSDWTQNYMKDGVDLRINLISMNSKQIGYWIHKPSEIYTLEVIYVGTMTLQKSKEQLQFLTDKLFALPEQKCGIEASFETEVPVPLHNCSSFCFQKGIPSTCVDWTIYFRVGQNLSVCLDVY